VNLASNSAPDGSIRPLRGAAIHLPGSATDYQPPVAGELTIDISARTVAEATDEIEQMLTKSGILLDDPVDLAANI
jgi:bifunctional enzyme CysN/CysC